MCCAVRLGAIYGFLERPRGLPGIGTSLRGAEVLPMSPDYSVTHVSGLHRRDT